MVLSRGKVKPLLIIALSAGLFTFLWISAGSARDWKERSLWDRPSGPPIQSQASLPQVDKPSDTPEKNPPTAEAKGPAKISLPRQSTPESPLSPELNEEFRKARHMSVAEYLRRYGTSNTKDEYVLGSMDVLNIIVYGEDELNRGGLRISRDGYITLPLIDRVKVDGLTPAQAETLITKKFRAGRFLKNPHITVTIKEFKSRQVLIMGAVKEPGRHSMEGNERLLEMLAKAGGIKFDDRGDVTANSIRILRTIKRPDGETERIAMDMDLESLTQGTKPQFNLVMQDKDVVYVPESPRFFVTGEVQKPGYYKIKDRPITVVEAITMAGGPTRTAALNRTRVVRVIDGKETTLDIPASDILNGDKNKDIIVQPNDVIVIPQSYF
jgi:polysaccharide export outer membrane protein